MTEKLALLFFIYSLVCILCAVTFTFESLFFINLLACLLLTPVLGYLILKLINVEKNNTGGITHYICERCELNSDQEKEHCPICLRGGHRIHFY